MYVFHLQELSLICHGLATSLYNIQSAELAPLDISY